MMQRAYFRLSASARLNVESGKAGELSEVGPGLPSIDEYYQNYWKKQKKKKEKYCSYS